MVSLTTSDNEQFTVDRDVAERSVLIKQMLEGKLALRRERGAAHCGSPDMTLRIRLLFCLPTDIGDTDQPIPLPNVSSNVLKKVSTNQLDGLLFQ